MNLTEIYNYMTTLPKDEVNLVVTLVCFLYLFYRVSNISNTRVMKDALKDKAIKKRQARKKK